jgi:hypothetical protein
MKKNLVLILCGLLLGAVAAWAVIEYVLPRWQRSAVDNTYWQVTSRLDQGGEAFAYLHAEEASKAVMAILDNLKQRVAALPEEKRLQATQGLGVAEVMFKGYGLDELSGLGFSSFAVKPGLHRVRVVLHHRPGRDKGLIWNMTGPAPRALDELEMLPADTALAAVSDYNLVKLIEWLSRIGPMLAPQVQPGAPAPSSDQVMALVKAGLQTVGIDADRLFTSYGGRLGFLLVLDPQKRVTLPAKEKPLSIPEPAIALLMRVNDNYVFDTLKAKLAPLGQPKISEEQGVRRIAFPALPLPFPLEPVIVQKGEWLVVASRPALADEMLGTGTPRLSASADFKAIAYKAPSRGNGFSYVSPVLLRLVAQVLRENKGGLQPESALQKITALLDASKGLYSVVENSDQGLVYTINHGFDISSLPKLVEAFVEIAAAKAKEAAVATETAAAADAPVPAE